MVDVLDDLDDLAEGAGVKRSKGPAVLLVAGLTALAGGGYLAYSAKSSSPQAASEGKPAMAIARTPGPLVELDPFVVNLNTGDEIRYLKCRLAIEFTSASAVSAFEAQRARARNALLLYLSDLTFEQTWGAKQKQAILGQLKAQLQAVVGAGTVERIYLQEFVVQ